MSAPLRVFTTLGFCLLALSGCQTTPTPQTGGLKYDAQSYVIKTPAQAKSLAGHFARSYSPAIGTPTSTADYSALTSFDYLQSFMKRPNHRVMAIGYPEKCGAYYGTGPYRSLENAVQGVLNQCLNHLNATAKESNLDCGCRLAMVNETLYLTPEEFSFRTQLPAVALVKDTKRGRREILGYAVTSGRSGHQRPLTFFTSNDQQVCKGHYTIEGYGTRGKAYFNCFDGKVKGPAVFKVAGYHEGQPFGTILIKAGDNELIMVYGLPTEEYYKRKDSLIKGAG